GNILNYALSKSSLGYTYDPATNRLTGVVGAKSYAFQYDLYGNVSNNGKTTFGYDDASTLRCAKCGLPDELTYAYDGLGNRVRTHQNGIDTYPVPDSSGRLMWEETSALGKLKEYVYLDGKQVAVRELAQ